MRWGTGGTGSTQKRQAGYIWGLAGEYLHPMAGEISPDMMFCVFCQKWSIMSAGGCGLVQMDAIGCVSMSESKNKAKRTQNGRSGHVL